MIIRKTDKKDIDKVYDIFEQASRFIASYGSNQWQENQMPNKNNIIDDINKNSSYVLEEDNLILAHISVLFEKESSYDNIKNGRWESNYDYGVIHRLAIADNYRGLGLSKLLFDFAENECIKNNIRSIRIDTHNLNQAMKYILKKRKYKKCGIVYIDDNVQREAFEKILIPFLIGDIIQLKKTHPCGNDIFKIMRLGMDFRLECEKCKSQIWLKRVDVSRRLKKRL